MLRFAPSPTGDMHIGDLRVALLNYIVSIQRKEDFLVRIEDTNKEKNIDGKDQEILDLLDLFGISYTQTIYQSQQYKFHSAMALQLMHEKKAFSCFCSNEWIDKKRKEAKNSNKHYSYDDACKNLPAELVIDNTNPFKVRINRPEKDILINDKIKGKQSFFPDDVDSFVILNQDKTSTHDFAVAIDDMISDISLIIRDEKYMSSAPKQDYIRKSLGYEKDVEYAHIPSIVDVESTSVKSLLEQGFLPQSITNYLLLLGTNTPTKIFTLEEAVKFIDIKNLALSPTTFNIHELKEINHQHLKNLDAKELSRYVGFADAEIGELARVYLEDVSTTKELKSKIEAIFNAKNIPQEFNEITNKIINIIKDSPHFENYNDFHAYVLKKSSIDEKKLSNLIYYLLTGNEKGPKIEKVYKYLKNYIGEIVR